MIRLDGKKVRFIATDRKYRTEPYPAIAPLDSVLNTYITGQHIDHRDKETKGNLTLAEITGEKEIKPEARLKLFPFVINDVDPVLIHHNREYDCTMDGRTPNNPKDYAEAHFIILQKNLVAKNKAEVKPRHKFHLEDKEADATLFVNNSDSVYEAEKLIREKASIEEYKDLVMMLNLIVPGFNVNHRILTDTRLKEVLLKQAKANPDSILKAFTKEGENILFIAQLVEKNIISYKVGNGYYDGEKFIAKDINGFLGFISETENSSLVGKFGKLLIDSKETA